MSNDRHGSCRYSILQASARTDVPIYALCFAVLRQSQATKFLASYKYLSQTSIWIHLVCTKRRVIFCSRFVAAFKLGHPCRVIIVVDRLKQCNNPVTARYHSHLSYTRVNCNRMLHAGGPPASEHCYAAFGPSITVNATL